MMRRTATRLASAEELGETKFKKRWDLGQYVIKGVIHQDMLGASRSRKATRAGTAGFGLSMGRKKKHFTQFLYFIFLFVFFSLSACSRNTHKHATTEKWRDSYEARHNPHERAMDPSTTASYYTDQRIHQTFKGLTTQTVEPRMFTREQLYAFIVLSSPPPLPPPPHPHPLFLTPPFFF